LLYVASHLINPIRRGTAFDPINGHRLPSLNDYRTNIIYNSYLLPSTVPRTHLRAFFLIISGWKFNAAQICSSSGNGVCLLLQQEINGLTVEVNDSYLTLRHVEVER
jgi:hypothetical protein